DRAIEILGATSGPDTFRQIAAGAIASGATSFTAQNTSDAATLSAGQWVIITEFDSGAGDIVLTEWTQVSSVAGAVVNLQAPLRTNFPNARTFGTAPRSGLGFFGVSTLVENCKVRDLMVLQPTAAQSNPS